MANAIVTHRAEDIIWVFDPKTRTVQIVDNGTVLETTTLAQAASRVTFHRNEAAKGVARVDASPYRKHNRAAQ